MYQAVTHGIRVRVTPRYLGERAAEGHGRYFWTYTVDIANLGGRPVQLVERHWVITDGNGKVEEVRGAGVVGEQPVIRPGQSFSYTSGCPLHTPCGFMSGTYSMRDEANAQFNIDIPLFSLDSPGVLTTPH